MRVIAAMAPVVLLASPTCAHSAQELRGARGLRVWGSQVLSGSMQPGMVSRLLAKVEAEWMTKAVSTLRGQRDNATTMAEVQESCSKIAKAIVEGSSGNKDNVIEYMSDVCASDVAHSKEELGCKNFATALQHLMSDDEPTNRNDLDFPSFCASYYKATVIVDAKAKKDREDKDAAEKEVAQEKAAKEAAEKKAAEEKAAKETAEKKAAEEKAAKEAAKKKAAEEKAAEEAAAKKAAEEKAEAEVREAEEKARKAADVAAAKRKAIAEKKTLAPVPAKEPAAKDQALAAPAKPETNEKKQLTLASVRSPKARAHQREKSKVPKQTSKVDTITKKLKQGSKKA